MALRLARAYGAVRGSKVDAPMSDLCLRPLSTGWYDGGMTKNPIPAPEATAVPSRPLRDRELAARDGFVMPARPADRSKNFRRGSRNSFTRATRTIR